MAQSQLTRRRLLSAVALTAALPRAALARDSKTQTALRWWRQYAGPAGSQLHVHNAAPQTRADETQSPLVCFHPSSSSGAFMREFQAQMATDRWVICPDTPGYGSSDKPSKRPTVRDYALTMADLMDHLGLGEKGAGRADLFGFHTGCLIATELAVIRPDLVRKLVLPGIPYTEGAEQVAEYEKNAQEKDYFKDVKALGRLWEERHEWLIEGTGMERLLELFGEEIRGGRDNWWAYHAVFTYDANSQFPKVTQPTLVIATGGDLLQPSIRSSELLANAQLSKRPDLDAPLLHAHYGEVAKLTRAFLDE